VFTRRGISYTWPWYYPTPGEYRERLEARHFTVGDLRRFPRPTRLPTGMTGWLRTFAGSRFSAVPPGQREAVEAEIVDLLAPVLCDRMGQWTADYVRLQVVASKLQSDRA
jgi:hypothetical protein